MLPFNFRYFKPKTAQDAVRLYQGAKNQQEAPYYFSGGTELVTLGRIGLDYADIVIDLKAIPGYEDIFSHEKYLVIGAGVTLTSIEEDNLFPLLSKTVSEIADRTSRNKITIGGNVCGKIFYREAVLPLLLADSVIGIMDETGLAYRPLNTIFNRTIQLQDGQFVFTILIEKEYLNLPYYTKKRRKQWNTGYPLVTIAAIKKGEEIRMAFSGVCPFPFRSAEIEEAMNEKALSPEERADRALGSLPSPILDDVEGSKEFRLYVLKNMIADAIRDLEGENIGQ
ncbi:FAD binding domain-containing protein [Bacillus sp. FJAT-27245]|uniref:FAD binding domain-containing protein n=1 Tax=Bacillus sp. FJAT-27245 TaxID=1684144 RepID=UPI0006A7A5F8|nr:FAD binding domain-containing protein [Bacillus sp. FJAT-27245]